MRRRAVPLAVDVASASVACAGIALAALRFFGRPESEPEGILAAIAFGAPFVSDDFAESWRKLDREFSEIRSVALTPVG